MATRKRKFGAEIPPEGAAPMTLEINGQEFSVRGEMSGLRILRIIEALEGTDEEGMDVRVLTSFISDAFLAQDRERGVGCLLSDEHVVTLPILIDIVQWLVSEYTGNPTGQPEQSDDSSETTGPTSSESASSVEQTSATLTGTPSGQSEQPTPVAQS